MKVFNNKKILKNKVIRLNLNLTMKNLSQKIKEIKLMQTNQKKNKTKKMTALMILLNQKRQSLKKAKKNQQLRKKLMLTGLGVVSKPKKMEMGLMNLKKQLTKNNNNSNSDGQILMPMLQNKGLIVLKGLKNYRRPMFNKNRNRRILLMMMMDSMILRNLKILLSKTHLPQFKYSQVRILLKRAVP